MLLRLAVRLQDFNCSAHVFSLSGPGVVGDKLVSAGIPVTSVQLKANIHFIPSLIKLAISIYRFQPDIIQTWMYHSDLFGGIISRLLGIKNIFWNVRHSEVDQIGMRLSTRIVVRICAFLSHFIPKAIVCNSRRSISLHSHLGYSNKKFVFIPNGFNVDSFKPNLLLVVIFVNFLVYM